jgi:hypothetical protein
VKNLESFGSESLFWGISAPGEEVGAASPCGRLADLEFFGFDLSLFHG